MREHISNNGNSTTATNRLHDRRCKLKSCSRMFSPSRIWNCFCSKQCKTAYWDLVRLEGVRIMEGANSEVEQSNNNSEVM